MADEVNEWTFCTEHRKAVDGGSCDECGGDRHLVQVVRRYYLDVALNQVATVKRTAFEDVQSHLLQHLPWEDRGRNVLALVTEYLTRPGT
jgi:hypothetical protein